MKKKVFEYSLSNVNLKAFEKNFKEKNKNYKMIQTSSSLQFISENERFVFAKSYLGHGAMNIIRNLKIDVYKNLNEGKFKLREATPKYFTYNPVKVDNKEGFFYPVTEIDLNSAYLQSAYFQNIISEKQFKILGKVHKKIRLRALGSLATKKTISIFENGDLIENKTTQSEEGLNIWKMICKGTDEMIEMLIYENERKNFIFYWFDNLFIHNSGAKLLENKLYKYRENLSLKYQYKLNNIYFLVQETNKMFNVNTNFTY